LSNLQARHLMEGHGIESTIQNMANQYPVMRSQYTRPPERSDRLYQAHYDHPNNQPPCSGCDPEQLMLRLPRPPEIPQPYVYYGLIASGDQVVRHGGMRDQLRRELGVLCFEMEAAGLIDSFPCLVIRGISDYADSHKNDLWQGYAASAAIAYAKELMGVIPVGCAHGAVNDRTLNGADLAFQIQQWLSPTGVKDDLFSHQKEVGAAPGSGKSTLTAFIIRCLMENANSNILYFFCKGTDKGKNQPFQVFRTPLSQLLAADGGNRSFPWVDRLRLQSGQKHAESFATLYEAFQHALTIHTTETS
ncbi:hypothetical protein ETB97_012872, partial [Aspergillus alliaceus]